ncbi:hypothetical protein [Candidatus Venteria ishoeyi]|uniref:Uncharacterized protein n=1 Tax=Candidatus Venteria ishoeyi TaxID=1899563 RepID=A0A1H6F7J9_9GAMM|nr:hypothetical protein [Candidatus Venteria ishoeyi]SEH05034.1 Uncharacterised protein [Candidatus Venteria ishoeyi]
MPQTSPNTQKQELTTSNNGLNVRPFIKGKSHFFCQTGNLTQGTSQCFGVVSPTEFRTTASLNIGSGLTKNIYAICSGRILIQPQSGSSTKVNLILKPFKQPINELPIKYFIYRGLNKSDFFTSASEPLIHGSETTGTEFVKHLWKEFNKFYQNEDSSEPTPDFYAKLIGFPTTTYVQDANSLIDEIYFKKTEYTDSTQTVEDPETSYELPIVPRGLCIGTAIGEIGMDIVLDDGDYYLENDPNPFKFDLEFARADANILNVNPAGNTYTDYQKKLIKETATRFIDPAAFYGLHANGAGEIYLNDDTTPTTDVDDIFSNVVNLFSTGNNTYLYIQGNRQRSYNFYGNYTYDATTIENLKIWDDPASVSTVDCGETNEWPVQVHSNGTELSIQLLTDKHEGAGAYVRIGDLNDNTPHENNFLRGENLVQTDTDGTIDENYTKPLSFSIPKTTGATPQKISTLIQLIYEGKRIVVQEYIDPLISPAPDPVYHKLKDIDDVFGLVNAKSIFKTDDTMVLPTVTDNIMQLINIPNSTDRSEIAVVKTKRTEDIVQTVDIQTYVNRITYETLLDNIKREANGFLPFSCGNIDQDCSGVNHYNVEQNNFFQGSLPYFLKTQIFTHRAETITSLSLHLIDGGNPTKKILGLSKDENEQLINLIDTHSLNNSILFLKNVQVDERLILSSYENIEYKYYSIGVVSEDFSGDLVLYFPTNMISIFTTDGLIYHSKSYSDFLPEIGDSNELLLNISLVELDLIS